MPLLLFVASTVWPFTVTRITAVLSLVVPVSEGEGSFVESPLMPTEGDTVSMRSSLLVPSSAALPKASVAVAVTL